MRMQDLIGKAKVYARKNPAQVNQALGKAGEALDKATKGRYRDQIDKGTEAVEKNLGTAQRRRTTRRRS